MISSWIILLSSTTFLLRLHQSHSFLSSTTPCSLTATSFTCTQCCYHTYHKRNASGCRKHDQRATRGINERMIFLKKYQKGRMTTEVLDAINSSAELHQKEQGRGGEKNLQDLQAQALQFHKEKRMTMVIERYAEIIDELRHSKHNHQQKEKLLLQEVTFQRALCLSQMGYVNEAIDGFQSAIDIRQQVQQDDKQSNDDDIASTSSHKPQREEKYLANIVLEGKGDKEMALNIYQQCGPQSPMVTLAGVCLDSLGRHDEAFTCYQNALQLKGGDADCESMIHLCINMQRQLHYHELRQQHEVNTSSSINDEIDNFDSSIQRYLSKMESSSVSSYLASSWKYAHSQTNVWHLPSTQYFTHDMMHLAMQHANLENGLILEFGVYFGKTIRMMANYFPNENIHGFDTFEGLPSDWFNTKEGSYSTHGSLPTVPSNVQFYKGLFSDTLPLFLDDCDDHDNSPLPIRLMNIDCDMYSSTKDVFDVVHDRIQSGTIIVFDEYICNPNWKEDEYKAFQEAVEKFKWQYEYLAISMVSQQAIVRIL